MKPWPEMPVIIDLESQEANWRYGGHVCNVDAAHHLYKNDYIDALMDRLRVAVDALIAITEHEQDSSTPDTFDVATEALATIGELPREVE